MRHFIAYHNRAKMGEHARPFQVYTNKSIRDLKDSVVWIVEGVGRSPKEYNLVSRFIVRKVECSPHAEFKTAGYGDGHEFRKKIRLNDFDWFADLRTKMGNFGFGLHPIVDSEILRKLEELAAREGARFEDAEE
jgi:hypothetical protein